ncbi:diacylglycerol kinase [Novosphingobium flavum]|uniref:Diacylglycerol kinase n=1 Tax=Novosphingobium flavum TaxID=1778672 RepID=A0A7X1FQI3_9SPHN|nr:diacylglycerol kinase family protein [Novosphingobium flavum]MBC2664567.1 diacylglycerol kinase [Novosphingobium flavum]
MSGSLWLVVNRASGSFSPELVEAVQAALAGAGRPPARVVEAQEGKVSPGLLDSAGVDTLVVMAGDGTVNGVATALEGWGGALLVLPGGTANLLARALHGEEDAPAIAARIAGMRRQRRPCIRWSGGTALVEVLAGPGAEWSEVREGLREGAIAPIAEKAAKAIRESTSGAMVALVDPPLGNPAGYRGLRLGLSGEAMAVEGYGAETLADYFKQGLALLRRNFREGPHDDLGTHGAVLCRSLGREGLALMVDGEKREGGRQERFSLAPFALDLLVTVP